MLGLSLLPAPPPLHTHTHTHKITHSYTHGNTPQRSSTGAEGVQSLEWSTSITWHFHYNTTGTLKHTHKHTPIPIKDCRHIKMMLLPLRRGYPQSQGTLGVFVDIDPFEWSMCFWSIGSTKVVVLCSPVTVFILQARKQPSSSTNTRNNRGSVFYSRTLWHVDRITEDLLHNSGFIFETQHISSSDIVLKMWEFCLANTFR